MLTESKKLWGRECFVGNNNNNNDKKLRVLQINLWDE